MRLLWVWELEHPIQCPSPLLFPSYQGSQDFSAPSSRVRNWSEYNLALRQRGSLTFWVSEDVIDAWLNINPTQTFGRAPTYSDIAILTMLSLKSLFGLAGRQTSGLMASLFDLMQINLSVPDHPSTSSGATAPFLGG